MSQFGLWRDYPLHILFVMATEQEYGPALQRRIEPLITGVGPVEAAGATGEALARLEKEHDLPQLVVSLGSAGSRNLEHAKVYQVSSICYRDMDCSPLGFERGVVPFLDEPAEIKIPHQIPGIQSASIATGASIVSGKMYDAIQADMVDMETYAVYRAAKRFGIPIAGLRGITDGKSELSQYEHWSEFLGIVDRRLAIEIDRLFAAIKSEEFSL